MRAAVSKSIARQRRGESGVYRLLLSAGKTDLPNRLAEWGGANGKIKSFWEARQPLYSRDLLTLRLAMTVPLALVFVSQLYWFRRAWQVAGRAQPRLRGLLRVTFVALACGIIAAVCVNFHFNASRNHLSWHNTTVMAVIGLWLSSALLAFLSVQVVTLGACLWGWLRPGRVDERAEPANPQRRRFVQGLTAVAGAAPFAGALYGFAFERLRYEVRRVELPIAKLPSGLQGLRIAQLSDIHIGNYMTAPDVHRAVDIANSLGADLTVVTGDFITGAGDPLEECIAELSRLRAPLGVWGCNGNHEIYADVEAEAQELFQRYGMRLLRQESARLEWRGQPVNLIGVDYELTFDRRGRRRTMLSEIEPLVRRDMPNILFSHNPNSFRRAAELGIELMLTGHTHGGQVRVEILDHRLSPARFLTPYVEGLYRRPMGASSRLDDAAAWEGPNGAGGASVVYVNRGLGTIGMPVRLGVPPEITLHTLTCA